MTQITGKKLTRQIVSFVALCLIAAEILIFVPSAAHFQYRWFETQWQHFLVQFDKNSESDLASLQSRYLDKADRSAIGFHAPDFICWLDESGAQYIIGHKQDETTNFNLGTHPMRHIGLALQIISGFGPDEVMVYDNRRSEDFRAIWSTELIRAQLQDYALRIAALTFLIALVIIAPLYWFLSRQFVRPLRHITSHMRQFADDPSALLEPIEQTSAAEEIAEIGTALSDLTDQVRRALRHKERLADIGEATAKINHDLRNILVSATLVTDTLSASEDPKIKRIAPHIERAISDAASMTQNLSHDTKLEIALSGASSLSGMPNMMYRLLLNLARNARAAGATSLSIDVWRAGHLAVIDISDDEPGIDKMLKPHLFSAFYSGHKSNTGLGLAIAKDLSLAMGGELRLSRSSRHGSEFRLSVPKSWLEA